MSSDPPPPYRTHFPEGASAPGFTPALSSQPAAFASSSYQIFPQTYTGGDQSFYQGCPGAFVSQPGYQGYHSGAPGAAYRWDGSKPYAEPPKHTVFMMGPQDQHHGMKDSCLKVCSALLCCCCLWDMFTSHLCCPLTSDLH
ncbi:cysteine-rich and transmembrane domain-containing protein 1-like [Betta splendens]|uniref:Cysteine-rich and transmembrane domain-containing protein 1-like n=1 Tax=Betta splendens TaxID=158456 RepID=A0A6P7PB39_BETSP|nr:cysteine-rich and transmembrane domain-containing protein 1-like [Betta splendens]